MKVLAGNSIGLNSNLEEDNFKVNFSQDYVTETIAFRRMVDRTINITEDGTSIEHRSVFES